MKKEIIIPIHKRHNCQVLVVGGGPAGIGAAIAAARGGAQVILAECNGFLGGTATACLVGPFMSCYDPQGKQQVIRGIFEELVQRMETETGAVHPSKIPAGDSHCCYRTMGHIGCTPYDAEVLKRVAEAMCLEAGVQLIYHMLFLQCEMENPHSIREAVFVAKDGLHVISADLFIDCTGDADLAYRSGAPTRTGDKDGITQVVSTFFMVNHIDKEKLDLFYQKTPEDEDYNRRYMVEFLQEAHRKGEFPCGRSEVNISEAMNELWFVNLAQIDEPVQAEDPESVTAAEIRGRHQIPQILNFMRRHLPGCEDARLIKSSANLGIRESRRIVGEYELCQQDILSGRIFPDGVLVAGNGIDSHNTQDNDYAVPCQSYTVPYRCFLPKGMENLLVAGRCLSADRVAHSAIRVIPPCFAMGQAVGTAASIAITHGLRPRDVDIQELRRHLRAGGAYLLPLD